jgi:hypothetical protein
VLGLESLREQDENELGVISSYIDGKTTKVEQLTRLCEFLAKSDLLSRLAVSNHNQAKSTADLTTVVFGQNLESPLSVESLVKLFDKSEFQDHKSAAQVLYLFLLDFNDRTLNLLFRQVFTNMASDLQVLDCLHSLAQGDHRHVQKYIQLSKHSPALSSIRVLIHVFDELNKSL